MREEPRLAAAFIVVVLVLLGTGATVTFRPTARPVIWMAAFVFGCLIAAYIASRTTGIPLVASDPEAVDAVGVIAVGVELLGLVCAIWLVHPPVRPTDEAVNRSAVPAPASSRCLAR